LTLFSLSAAAVHSRSHCYPLTYGFIIHLIKSDNIDRVRTNQNTSPCNGLRRPVTIVTPEESINQFTVKLLINAAGVGRPTTTRKRTRTRWV